MRRIGLISDTHGLVRPDVHEALAGVELILQAGDVGGDAILDELRLIAPVHAVWGNTDPPGTPGLSEALSLTVDGVRIHVQHGHELGRPSPEALLAAYDEAVLGYGHTHRQLVVEAAGRLVVNPGAAGPRRFDLRPSVAVLAIGGGRARAALVALRG
ncbi:MAG: metallophosphoesterase family protein [Gemmatimonadota bacterium]